MLKRQKPLKNGEKVALVPFRKREKFPKCSFWLFKSKKLEKERKKERKKEIKKEISKRERNKFKGEKEINFKERKR